MLQTCLISWEKMVNDTTVNHRDTIRWIAPAVHILDSHTTSVVDETTFMFQPSAHILTLEKRTTTHYFWSAALPVESPMPDEEMIAIMRLAFDPATLATELHKQWPVTLSLAGLRFAGHCLSHANADQSSRALVGPGGNGGLRQSAMDQKSCVARTRSVSIRFQSCCRPWPSAPAAGLIFSLLDQVNFPDFALIGLGDVKAPFVDSHVRHGLPCICRKPNCAD